MNSLLVVKRSLFCIAAIVATVGSQDALQQSLALAEPPLTRVAPREPAEAERTFESLHGFQMQLVAAEPLVTDPVAAAFDENGRLFVAEMIDYPIPPDSGRAPLGRVRLLSDHDGDGRYEHSTIFADAIVWPTGVVPWRGGVFVAAAPDIWYLKDHDGDGKADRRDRVFTGFGTQNQQGTVNNLAWSLDNRIYGSASGNSGQIRRGEHSQEEPLDLGGHDFRFDPSSLGFEAVSGHRQFGNAFDDWGNRFVCSESNPGTHVVLPAEYLARNPHLPVASALENLAPGVTRIFRTSPVEAWRAVRSHRRLQAGERAATSAGLSHEVIDAAAGLAIYRGDAFPEQYRGNLFVGCSQNNLIHRRPLVPEGATFRSERADEGTEFVRTNDIWFRPVNCINAPDGTLYVLDMSREVIEAIHIPLDVVAQLDLTSGRNRGRIYRLAPPGFQSPDPPRMGASSTPQLVEQLGARNGWTRDTAQRLLYERQDHSAAPLLQALLRTSDLPQARLHALYALEGLRALSDDDRLAALNDRSPRVREHAIRRSEHQLDDVPPLFTRVLELAGDDDARVRFQVALSLGYSHQPRAVDALARLALRDAGDRWLSTAILSSANDTAAELCQRLATDSSFVARPEGVAFLDRLVAIVGSRLQPAELADASRVLANLSSPVRARLLLHLYTAMRQHGAAPAKVFTPASAAGKVFAETIDRARQIAADQTVDVSRRETAIRLLAFGDFSLMREPLASIVGQREHEELRLAAIHTLAQTSDPHAGDVLIAGWRHASPSIRVELFRALVARVEWTKEFLSALERADISPDDLATSQRQEVLNSTDEEVRQRAQVLLGRPDHAREQVVARFQSALSLEGDAPRGDAIYERECAACHRLGERGYVVGPNLALTRNRTPDQLLVHILDPNRDVQPAYLQYVVVDHDGRQITGIVSAETATSLTLLREKGASDTILKSKIAELSSTGRSLMPEGLEKSIDPQGIADLIAFLRSVQYDVGTIPGQGIPGQVEQ